QPPAPVKDTPSPTVEWSGEDVKPAADGKEGTTGTGEVIGGVHAKPGQGDGATPTDVAGGDTGGTAVPNDGSGSGTPPVATPEKQTVVENPKELFPGIDEMLGVNDEQTAKTENDGTSNDGRNATADNTGRREGPERDA